MVISGRQGHGGLVLLVPYVLLLLVVGIIPAGYAIYQSFLAAQWIRIRRHRARITM